MKFEENSNVPYLPSLPPHPQHPHHRLSYRLNSSSSSCSCSSSSSFSLPLLVYLSVHLVSRHPQYGQDFRISFSEQSRSLISAGEIILLMETVVDSIVGMPIKDLPINQLERRIEQQTNIKNAEVFLSLDHCLHIDIQQKTPIARIKFAYQNEYYMDENGKMFDLSSIYLHNGLSLQRCRHHHF